MLTERRLLTMWHFIDYVSIAENIYYYYTINVYNISSIAVKTNICFLYFTLINYVFPLVIFLRI